MDTYRLPIKSVKNKFEANLYFRAEITLEGKVVCRLKGKNNTGSQLQNFIDENWRMPVSQEVVEHWQPTARLKVWQYRGVAFERVLVDIRRPGLLPNEDSEEFLALLKEVDVKECSTFVRK